MRYASLAAAVVLGAHGIGHVHFGETKRAAVAGLSALFGAPTARMANAGCSPRYTEVAWGRLVAEFRDGRFSGFRYQAYSWAVNHAPVALPAIPRLVTADGITLGSTLADLRAKDGPLRLVGTDRWESPDGLVFYDNAKHDPVPPSSRIVEIKVGTCGDF